MKDTLRAVAVTLPLLLGPFAWAASTDWDLVTSAGEHACATSRDTCEAAIAAVQRGWFALDWRDLALRCKARPGCFSARSECIRGHSC